MYDIAECFGIPKHPGFHIALEAVGDLRTQELKDVILYRYFGRMGWDEVANLMGRTPEECLDLHGIAVRVMQRAMERISKEATK